MSEIDLGSLRRLLEGGPPPSAASLEQVVSRRDRHSRRRMRSLAVLALAVALGVAGGLVGRLDSGTVPAAAARAARPTSAMSAHRPTQRPASAPAGSPLAEATLTRPRAARAQPGCAGPTCGLGPLRRLSAQRGPISVRVFTAPRAKLTWREGNRSCRFRGAAVAEWSDAGAASTTVLPLAPSSGALRAVALGRLSVDPTGEAQTVLVETGPRVVAVTVHFANSSLGRARPHGGLSALSSLSPLGGRLNINLYGADGPLGTVSLNGGPRVLLAGSCRAKGRS